MHKITTVWVTLWMFPLVITTEVNSRVETDTHNNLLRAILWETRQFEEFDKRSHYTISQHNGLSDCCPTETRRIAPLGGLSRDGRLLQLYRDPRTVQRFYETKCLPDVINRPCNFIDSAFRTRSKCVQEYTYMYAIAKDYNTTQPYRIDYIRMKSGCSCKIEDIPSTIIELT